MLEALRLDPWSSSDKNKILDYCEEHKYSAKEEESGVVCIDFNDPKNQHINRSSFLSDLRRLSVRFDLAKAGSGSYVESLDLLKNLMITIEQKGK